MPKNEWTFSLRLIRLYCPSLDRLLFATKLPTFFFESGICHFSLGTWVRGSPNPPDSSSHASPPSRSVVSRTEEAQPSVEGPPNLAPRAMERLLSWWQQTLQDTALGTENRRGSCCLTICIRRSQTFHPPRVRRYIFWGDLYKVPDPNSGTRDMDWMPPGDKLPGGKQEANESLPTEVETS